MGDREIDEVTKAINDALMKLPLDQCMEFLQEVLHDVQVRIEALRDDLREDEA